VQPPATASNGRRLPDGCGQCDQGYTVDYFVARQLSDYQALEDNLFCGCELGQFVRRQSQARHEDYLNWLAETNRANQANRALLFKKIGVPDRFKDFTLAGYRHLAGNDSGHATALKIAETLSQYGKVKQGGTHKNSVFLHGPRGTGKTGLLVPIFMSMARAGTDCLFVPYLSFMRLVRAGYELGDANEKIERAMDAGLLFIDDLGQTRRTSPETEHSRAIIQDIIYHRHGNNMPTYITSNLGPEEISEQFSEETWQRIAEMAVVASVTGKVIRDSGVLDEVDFSR